jgi:hypothetical protein
MENKKKLQVIHTYIDGELPVVAENGTKLTLLH